MHPANKVRGVGLYTKFLFEHLQQLPGNHTFALKTDIHQSYAADLTHYPYFDFFFSTLPAHAPTPTVVTIHDCIPLIYPDHYKPGFRGRFNYIKQKIKLGRINHIITNSVTSKNDIAHFLKVKPAQISPIPMAGNPLLSASAVKRVPELIASLKLTKPFFLYVGDINYNKNVSLLLTAFKPLKSRAHLVMVSHAMAHDIPESLAIRQLISDLSLEHDVILAANIPNKPIDALQWLYQNAIAYVQPSYYEGFGIPVIEALSCGTPVISSMGGSLKEFASAAIFPFDPLDATSLTNALEQLLNLPPKVKTSLKQQAVAFANKYSWQKCAANTLNVYKQVVGA
jgi:glycosyltransferase involved in cell wall biosynthesis